MRMETKQNQLTTKSEFLDNYQLFAFSIDNLTAIVDQMSHCDETLFYSFVPSLC